MMKVKNIKNTCGACPSQWEGNLDDGRMIYIRYRWGYLSIRVSNNPSNDVYDAVDGEEVFGKQVDEGGWAGVISYEAVKQLTKGIIEFPNESE